MFLTQEDAEVSFPAQLMGPGARCWDAVELTTNVPFLIAQLGIRQGKTSEFRRLLLLSTVAQLDALQAQQGVTLIQLTVALPPYLAAHKKWAFEEVVEAWECEDPENPFMLEDLVVLSSGKEQVLGFSHASPAGLTKLTLAYARDCPQRPASRANE